MSNGEPLETEQDTPEDNLDPEKLDEAEAREPQQFGTFGGVFVPTLLTSWVS